MDSMELIKIDLSDSQSLLKAIELNEEDKYIEKVEGRIIISEKYLLVDLLNLAVFILEPAKLL